MIHQVLIASSAFDDLQAISTWIADQGSILAAERWLADILSAIETLDSLPERCPVASEARGWASAVIHVLLAGQYRVLFTVAGEVVVVLRIRHAQRSALANEELLAALRRGLTLLE